MSNYAPDIKPTKEELITDVIQHIVETNAYAVDKNDLIRIILTAKSINKREKR